MARMGYLWQPSLHEPPSACFPFASVDQARRPTYASAMRTIATTMTVCMAGVIYAPHPAAVAATRTSHAAAYASTNM